MKRTVLATLLFFLGLSIINAQNSTTDSSKTGFSNLGALSLLVPIGEFANTHTVGAGLTYNWSHFHFGYFKPGQLKRIGFMVSTGMEYYFGKKNTTTAGNSFSFKNYFNFNIMPGAIYHFHKKADVNLVAGPNLAIHNSISSFAFGSNLHANYYIQPNLAIGVGVLYKKHEYVRSLWSASLRMAYTF